MNSERYGRPNQRQAEIIDNLLQATSDASPRAVARLLADLGVSFAVICRVVSEPSRRRQVAPPDRR